MKNAPRKPEGALQRIYASERRDEREESAGVNPNRILGPSSAAARSRAVRFVPFDLSSGSGASSDAPRPS